MKAVGGKVYSVYRARKRKYGYDVDTCLHFKLF